MKKWGYRLAPRSRRARVEALSEEITGSVGNYVIGQAAVAVLNATFAFIVMSIIGVPFATLLAFVVALLAFIPLVGGMIAGFLVTLVALTAGWQTALVFAICYFAYLQFEAYFISPRIMQKAVAVPGAVAVISVIAGGSLLGVARSPDRHSHGGGRHAAGQGDPHRPPGQPLTVPPEPVLALKKDSRTVDPPVRLSFSARIPFLGRRRRLRRAPWRPVRPIPAEALPSGTAGDDLVHDLVEHTPGVLLPHPQVLGAVDAYHLEPAAPREPLAAASAGCR